MCGAHAVLFNQVTGRIAYICARYMLLHPITRRHCTRSWRASGLLKPQNTAPSSCPHLRRHVLGSALSWGEAAHLRRPLLLLLLLLRRRPHRRLRLLGSRHRHRSLAAAAAALTLRHCCACLRHQHQHLLRHRLAPLLLLLLPPPLTWAPWTSVMRARCSALLTRSAKRGSA